MAGKIFVNYRRDDSADQALSVTSNLERTFGARNVFLDIDRLRAGQNFPKVLEEKLGRCKVMLVLIGPRWLTLTDDDGRRRIDDPKDWVRLEITRALARGITVIPVLVGGAKLPKESELPDDLKSLVDHHTATITTNGFRNEMAGLVRDIKAIPQPRAWGRIAAMAAGVAALLAVAVFVSQHFNVPLGPTQAERARGEAQVAAAKIATDADARRKLLAAAASARAEADAAEAERQRQSAEAERAALDRLKAETDRKRAEAATEAKRKADESERQRQAAIKAEEDRRLAAEAERARLAALKAEEDRKRAEVAAEAKRKAEEALPMRKLGEFKLDEVLDTKTRNGSLQWGRQGFGYKLDVDKNCWREACVGEVGEPFDPNKPPLANCVFANSCPDPLYSRRAKFGRADIAYSVEPGSGKSFRDRLANGQPCPMCPEMVVAPAGTFTMGSPKDEPERSPIEVQIPVKIDKPFAVGNFAVTFDEWDACVAAGGCNGYKPSDAGWGRERRPVINVNWEDAKAYAAWLSKTTGKSYRLLSEAEREYVTRAGTTTPFWWGNSISPKLANYDGSDEPYKGGGEKGDYRFKTMPVDSFEANPWGLYNVHGNVWDWTEDCWNNSNAGNPGDGVARITGDCSKRVYRGGSWLDRPAFVRSAFRLFVSTERRDYRLGFRLARTLNP